MAGSESGSEKGKVMLVVRELYGLNLSGADFRDLLDEQFHELGYRPSIAETDV